MRRKILPAVLGILSLASVTTRANDIEPSKEFYTVPRAANPIVLDGNLSEWSGVPVLADPKFYVRNGCEGMPCSEFSGGTNATLVLFERYNGGTWSGPDDHTSAVQIVYDADNVYFGFVVTDDYHENVSRNAWNGDSVQIMIAGPGRTNQVALYNYALGGYEDNSGVLVTNDPAGTSYGGVIIHHEALPPGQTVGVTQAVITRNSVTHRTTYEIKLPKEALGLTTLAGGPQFGLGMAVNDGDGAVVNGVPYGQGGTQEGQKGWGGLGVHSIVFNGKNPTETALVTLTRGNDIEPGKEFYTASPLQNPFVLDGNLSEWTGIPVLADPKFYVRDGCEGDPSCSKFSAGVGGHLVLFERCPICTDDPNDNPDWTGPDDQTSAVQIAYDADNVYFGFVVTDEYHENAQNSPWNGDSIQLMIADATRTREIALYNYALGGVEDNLGTTIVEHERPVPPPGITEAVVTRNTNTHRTTYEIKLPKSAVGLTNLAIGAQFGLGMAINDGDQAAPTQGGWGGLGAHAIVFGKNPTETALITLGTAGGGNDRLFFSAINPTIDFFAFRVNDRGAAILDPTSVRLVIDGVTNTPTASPKNLDATDFKYTPSRPFLANMDHTYLIVARDTLGTTVTSSGSFHTPQYAYLDASDKVTANTDGPGFMWSIHQNAQFTANSISRALHQLAGLLGENFADEFATGPTFSFGQPNDPGNYPMTFEIEDVINLEQSAPTADTQMPGLPGTGTPGPGQTDGVAVEITTFVDLPAGTHTLIVNSDDNFRTIAGHINDLFLGQTAGEFDQPTGRSAADTSFDIRVAEAGTYPFRTIYEEGTDAASIQWKMRKEDGTQVYLNDVANGGFRTWRHANGLRTGINMVSPLPNATGISRFTPIFASIREGTTTVDLSTVRLRLDGNLLSATPSRAGNVVTVRYQTPTALGGSQHTATLSYTAGGTSRTQSWNFVLAPAFSVGIQRTGSDIDVTWTEPGVTLQESIDLINWSNLTTTGNSYRATPDPRRMVFYRLRK